MTGSGARRGAAGAGSGAGSRAPRGPYRAPNPYDLATWSGGAGAGRARDPRIAAALAEIVEVADPAGDGDGWGGEPGAGEAVADRRGVGDEADGSAVASGASDDDQGPFDPPDLPRDLVDPFELARRTVNQSRVAARDRGLFPISAKTQARDARDRSASAPGYSGARPDPRDPQGVEAVLRRVLGSLGWSEGMSSGRVLEEWDEIVGEQIAAQCRPVSLDAGVLLVSASSSAWATQLRMLSPQLITRIHEHVGAAVVSELKVTGPAAQSWKKGRRTVTWRGPRDTYG
ncbi:DciA family protein [Brachybacterium huguangmaarense]